MLRQFRLLPPAVLAVASAAASAGMLDVEKDTTPQLAFRAATTLQSGTTLDATVTYRADEGFEAHDREIAEVRVGQRYGENDWMAAYHIEADRRGSLGNEHRLWQQFRHQFKLEHSSIESALRLEERYFDSNYTHGQRLRWNARWITPLTDKDQLRIGYEMFYNLNTISRTTVTGISQDRFITSIQHSRSNGDKVEFEWQARYLHNVGAPSTIVNQLQLLYIYNF